MSETLTNGRKSGSSNKVGTVGGWQAKNPGAILSQRNNWRLRETGPSIRGKADRFALSSATKSPPDSGPGGWCEGGTAAAAAADGINDRRKL